MKIIAVISGILISMPNCFAAPLPKCPDGKPVSNHKILVEEVIQTTSYTYLHVKENETEKWLAVPSMQASKGDTYYYSEGLPMKQFESKELHRTFDEVLFLGGVSAEPFTAASGKATPAGHGQNAASQPYNRKAVAEAKRTVKIETPKDCITIGELFAKKEFYAGKTIRIKGQVT